MHSILPTGLLKKVRTMLGFKRGAACSLSAAFLLSLALAGCGDPYAPGLGAVQINDGSDEDVSFEQVASGGVCDFTGASVYFQIIAFKTDADLGGIEFGSNNILNIQDPPPTVQPITNASVVLLGIDGSLLVQHSNNPLAPFFSDPGLVLDTTTGFSQINTGDSGVSYVVMTYLGGLIAEDTEAIVGITFIGALGGEGFTATMTFNCQAP